MQGWQFPKARAADRALHCIGCPLSSANRTNLPSGSRIPIALSPTTLSLAWAEKRCGPIRCVVPTGRIARRRTWDCRSFGPRSRGPARPDVARPAAPCDGPTACRRGHRERLLRPCPPAESLHISRSPKSTPPSGRSRRTQIGSPSIGLDGTEVAAEPVTNVLLRDRSQDRRRRVGAIFLAMLMLTRIRPLPILLIRTNVGCLGQVAV